MAFNPEDGAFSLDLSLFGSKVTDLEAADLPMGAMPANGELMFFAGAYATRPAFVRNLLSPLGSLTGNTDVQVTGVADYPAPDGDFFTILEDNFGNIWTDDVVAQTGPQPLTTVSAGTSFRSTAAFSKLWMAFFSPLPQPFSDSSLVGTDVPRYYDGQNVWRVTQDAPGGGLSVAAVTLAGNTLVAGSVTAGPAISSIYSSDPTGFNVPVPGGYVVTTWATMTVVLASAATLTVGQTVQMTGISWTPTGGPQWASGVPVLEVLSPESFKIAYASNVTYSGTGGTTFIGTPTLSRTGNIVTAYLGGTSQTNPTPLQKGWFVDITDPEGTGGTPASTPATTNALFQAMGGASSTFTGDGSGNITVVTPEPIINLPVGSWLYFSTVIPPSEPLLSFVVDGAGHVTFTLASNPYQVGQMVSLVDLYVTDTPTFVGSPILTITAVTSSTFTCNWIGPYQSNTLTSGVAIPVGTLYANGYVQVTQVLSQNSLVFFVPSNSATGVENGTIYDYFGSLANAPASPNTPATGTTNVVAGFQILSVDTATGTGPNVITWFQSGSDNVYTGSDALEAVPQTQIAPGPRNLVVFFYLQNGAVTGVSTPITYNGNGGSSFAAVTIPLGPPGTVARGVAWTPAFGDNYYALSPGFVPQIAGNGPTITTGTIVADNYTTSVIMDFSDAQLTASSALQVDNAGSEFGNLFNYVRLQPCLGVEQYQSRLGWWGQINVTPMVNLGFDGGYTPQTTGTLTTAAAGVVNWATGAKWSSANVGEQIALTGLSRSNVALYTINRYISPTSIAVWPLPPVGLTSPFTVISLAGAQPLGWDASEGDEAGYLVQSTPQYFGFSYAMPGGNSSLIEQSAYQDAYSAPVLLPTHSYLVRLLVKVTGFNLLGTLNADVYSPSLGALGIGTLSSGSVALSTIPLNTLTWVVITLNNPMPNTIPTDAVFRIYLRGTESGQTVIIDEVEPIDTFSPVLYNELIWSYAANPFGYDSELGLMGVPTSDSLTNGFELKNYFMIQSNNSLFQTADNGGDPNTWPVTLAGKDCGCSGPNAAAVETSTAIWVGRHGLRLFYGGEPRKISQFVNADFEAINWAASVTCWVSNDPIMREIRVGLPVNGALSCNIIEVVSYRLADSLFNIPDPVHVSPYSGKMICTDLGQKFTTWNIPMNCGKMCSRLGMSGITKMMVFGGGSGQGFSHGSSWGNLYVQDTHFYPPLNRMAASWNCKDDDYGQIGLPATNPVPLLPNMGNGTTVVSPIVTNNLGETYYWFMHDTEQAAQGVLGQHMKLFEFLALHATGVGNVVITPLADSYESPLWTLPLTPLSLHDIGRDLEFVLNHKAERLSLMVQVVPVSVADGGDGVSAAIWVTHMVMAGKKDAIFPVNGSAL